jgi:hypothetical protein
MNHKPFFHTHGLPDGPQCNECHRHKCPVCTYWFYCQKEGLHGIVISSKITDTTAYKCPTCATVSFYMRFSCIVCGSLYFTLLDVWGKRIRKNSFVYHCSMCRAYRDEVPWEDHIMEIECGCNRCSKEQ